MGYGDAGPVFTISRSLVFFLCVPCVLVFGLYIGARGLHPGVPIMAGEYNFAVPLREFDNAAHLTSNLLAAELPVRSVSQRSDGTYTVKLQPGATQAQRDQASAMAASYVDLRYKTRNVLATDISSMQAVDYGKLTDM